MARSDQALTARAAGLVGCRHCGTVAPLGTELCPRCKGRLHSRFPHSLQRTWAWWIAGLITYVPANLYPMMIMDTFVTSYKSTIVGGAIELIHSGDAFVGLVVILASVVIPTSKFLAIAYVALALRNPRKVNPHLLHKVYEVVEFIGRWSMIDVFVVAILSALVHLGAVATILPGIAAISFGSTVIFTMFSALSLDPRLIWDTTEEAKRERSRPRRA
ncbi:MAG: paraquat-inducible protein A [Rhodobacteraceae bacterium]|nr:paraquat-inducible protein A [Paracoccaceae bacterium]